jgi:hypothetical protein
MVSYSYDESYECVHIYEDDVVSDEPNNGMHLQPLSKMGFAITNATCPINNHYFIIICITSLFVAMWRIITSWVMFPMMLASQQGPRTME